MLNTTVTVGSGKAIHWGNDCGTICGAAHRNGSFTTPRVTTAGEVTCKRCIKAMAAHVEAAHAEALELNKAREFEAARAELVEMDLEASAKLAELVAPAASQEVLAADIQPNSRWISGRGHEVVVTRVHGAHGVRVSFRRTVGAAVEGVETGTLPLAMFLESFKRQGQAVQVLQVFVRELLDTDTVVMHPDAVPAHVIRHESLEIVRQRYGLYYRFDQISDGVKVGRFLRTLRYTDRLWVERAA